MADVAIARCERYENAEAALLEALAPFGGLDWARPGMKVALKVNLVSGGKPDSAGRSPPEIRLRPLPPARRARGGGRCRR